jgi:hypothetical protein
MVPPPMHTNMLPPTVRLVAGQSGSALFLFAAPRHDAV